MTCCGKKRAQWPSTLRNETGGGVSRVSSSPVNPPPGMVYFKYMGRSGVTVLGPTSGRTYQFFGLGAIAAVDPRDAPAVGSVPHLVRVAHP
jgi:hypothetical protein